LYHDEEKYQKLLDKANADAEKSTGEKLLLLNKRIEALSELPLAKELEAS
jgi:hypothetical protein